MDQYSIYLIVAIETLALQEAVQAGLNRAVALRRWAGGAQKKYRKFGQLLDQAVVGPAGS